MEETHGYYQNYYEKIPTQLGYSSFSDETSCTSDQPTTMDERPQYQ